MKTNLLLIVLCVLFSYCSQEKKLLRKASNAVDRSDFDKAVSYYDQIIQKDTGSFFGNAGKGIVLSEFMNRHEQAIPHLEKALRNSPKNSKPVIHGNLGRSYHYIGNYKRALEYYAKIEKTNDEAYSDYDAFLTKRIADCRYAISHPEIASSDNQSVMNLGKSVNTDAPEYAPVYAQGELLFTSKRQDDPKEKKNGVDGRYFENIYVSKPAADSSFGTPELYKLPFKNQLRKYGESVASVSADGQSMFVYKGGKIYETRVNELDKTPEMLDSKINESTLLNYAALSPDKNTLFFTRESDRKNGMGGSDIYMSTRGSDGSWTEPRLLPYPVNTEYDEESPYMNESGVLFFSSNGHPGYGGFDVYRTKLVNNNWVKPENLGQPVNSPADDIYFSLRPRNAHGFFASSRSGGYGDLDIYKVKYILTDAPSCSPDPILTINTEKTGNPNEFSVQLQVPEQYKNSIRSYRWMVNGETIAQSGDKFTYTAARPGENKITARVVAACDTCPALLGFCTETTVVSGEPILTSNDAQNQDYITNRNDKSKNALANSGKNPKKPAGKNSKAEDAAKKAASNSSAVAAGGTQKNTNAANGLNNNNGNSSQDNQNGTDARTATAAAGSSEPITGKATALSKSQLQTIGWNESAPSFELNKSDLNETDKSALQSNLAILKSKTMLSISITGHADSRGSEAYNRGLSKRRAESVRDYLVQQGLSKNRIRSVKGAGESALVNECADGVECSEDKHAQNRRVVIEVLTTEGNQTLTVK